MESNASKAFTLCLVTWAGLAYLVFFTKKEEEKKNGTREVSVNKWENNVTCVTYLKKVTY